MSPSLPIPPRNHPSSRRLISSPIFITFWVELGNLSRQLPNSARKIKERNSKTCEKQHLISLADELQGALPEWLLLRFPGLKTLGPYRGHGQTEAEQCQHRSKSNTDVAMGHFYNTFCLYFFALFSSSALLPKGSVCLWRKAKEGIFIRKEHLNEWCEIWMATSNRDVFVVVWEIRCLKIKRIWKWFIIILRLVHSL